MAGWGNTIPETAYTDIELQGRTGSVQRVIDENNPTGQGVQAINGINNASITIQGDGTYIQVSGAGATLVITFLVAALGLGGLATLDPGVAVANLNLTASAGYVQAELQSVTDKLDALLTSLRDQGIIET